MTAQNNQITAPRVDLIDENTGKIRREWYMFLYNLYTITGAGTGITPVANGGTGLGTIPTNGQLLIGNGTGYALNTLGYGVGISVTNGAGTIVVANTGVLSNIAGTGISVSGASGNVTISNTGVISWSGGLTGLTPATATTGAITLGGLLAIGYGGTNGTATPTAGAVSYGTGTAYAFTSAGTSGQVLTSAGASTPTWTTPTTGTVTSVGLSMPTQFTVTNSPVTTSGTLTAAWNTQTANYVLAGPTTGVAATPTFRALVASDIPTLSYVTSVSGTTGRITSTGGTTPVIDLASGVASAGTTGSSTLVPVITIDTYGRVTSVTTAANPQGTVTSVSGTGTVNGITLTGTVTSSGSLTLGGTLGSIANSQLTNSTISGVALGGSLFNLTAGTGVSFSSGTTYNGSAAITITATGSGGTVTSVTGTSPVVSSGGTTPAISLAAAYGDTLNPYASKTANYVLAAPNGSAGVPTFRALVAADVPGSALTKTDDTNVTLTLGGSPTTALLNAASLTLGWTGQLAVGRGGTGLSAGTSGGIPYFSSTSAMTSSALLTQYGVIYGGGAGASPVATAAGTTGQVLTATTGGAPTWAAPATSGTVTSIAQSFTGGLISVAGSPITSSGTLALTVAGTSGGIPYFSSATTWATSAALAANSLVQGGGAGVAPSTITTGTGVVTALGVNTGSAGAFVVNGGALGTPSSGTVTNLTGTASININGTVGATTATTGAFTTITASSTIKGATTISVGNATPSGSGAGITFPATQSASTDANTLDDYEEGTWTAAFVSGGGTITINTSYRTGKYVKVGSKVTVTGVFTISAISSPTGYLQITGLPFANGSADSNNSAPSIYALDLAATATTALQGRLNPSQTALTITRFIGGTQSDLASSVTVNTQFVLSLTYFV